ncbi:hypothetical protein JNUCC23_11190 [Peribacillus sp. JNUCC 23]
MEEPRTNGKYQFTDVFDSFKLEQINNVQGTGIYQIFGYRSTTSSELEELLKEVIFIKIYYKLSIFIINDQPFLQSYDCFSRVSQLLNQSM